MSVEASDRPQTPSISLAEEKFRTEQAAEQRILGREFVFAAIDLTPGQKTGLQAMGIRTVDQLLAASGNWAAFNPKGHEYSLPPLARKSVSDAITSYIGGLEDNDQRIIARRQTEHEAFWETVSVDDVGADLIRFGVTTNAQLLGLAERDTAGLTRLAEKSNTAVEIALLKKRKGKKLVATGTPTSVHFHPKYPQYA